MEQNLVFSYTRGTGLEDVILVVLDASGIAKTEFGIYFLPFYAPYKSIKLA